MARGTNKAKAARSKSSQLKQEPSGNEAEHEEPNDAPLELQQKCLAIFRDALTPSREDVALLQEVKGHLYDRNFATAFGKEEYLRVYASRWSPSRALCYLQILMSIQDDLLSAQTKDGAEPPLTVVCVGGGAGAEVVALAGWLHLLRSSGDVSYPTTVNAQFLDIAAWDNIVTNLHKATITPAELSKYASSSAKATNGPLLPEDAYCIDFEQVDMLAMSDEKSRSVFSGVEFVTLMFTLNELYATSIQRTQQLLARLTDRLSPGAHLLVVDSPGSYSTVPVNGAEKKYPMQWLLDYTLIGAREKNQEKPLWHKVLTDQSRWFRLPQGLTYPIDLENMRYQIHLYRKLDSVGED